MLSIFLPSEPDPRDLKIEVGSDPHAVSENQILAISSKFGLSSVKISRGNLWDLVSSCSKGLLGYVKPGHVLYIAGDKADLKALSRDISACKELEVRAVKWLHQVGSKLVDVSDPASYDGTLILETPGFVPGSMTSMVILRKVRNEKKEVRHPRTGKPKR